MVTLHTQSFRFPPLPTTGFKDVRSEVYVASSDEVEKILWAAQCPLDHLYVSVRKFMVLRSKTGSVCIWSQKCWHIFLEPKFLAVFPNKSPYVGYPWCLASTTSVNVRCYLSHPATIKYKNFCRWSITEVVIITNSISRIYLYVLPFCTPTNNWFISSFLWRYRDF